MGEKQVLKRFEVALDISRSIANRAFTVVEGDTGNELHITLTDNGVPVDLSGCRVLAIFSKSTGTSSQDSGIEEGGITLGGENGNEVTISLFNTSFAPGMVECELQVYSGTEYSTLVTSAKFNFSCRRGILNGETVQATSDYPVLIGLMAETEKAAAAAYAAAAATGQYAHAYRHGAQGEDPLSPADIGAAEKVHGHSVEELGAAAAEHGHMPEEVGAEAAKLALTDTVVAAADWAEDTAYANYPYRAAVAVEGVTANMTADVIFAVAEAAAGIYAPVNETYAGGIYLYAAEQPAADITVPRILIWR